MTLGVGVRRMVSAYRRRCRRIGSLADFLGMHLFEAPTLGRRTGLKRRVRRATPSMAKLSCLSDRFSFSGPPNLRRKRTSRSHPKWGRNWDPRISLDLFVNKINEMIRVRGGERGIRTLDRVSPIHAFQACAFNHSATSPAQSSRGWLRPPAREGAQYTQGPAGSKRVPG